MYTKKNTYIDKCSFETIYEIPFCEYGLRKLWNEFFYDFAKIEKKKRKYMRIAKFY